MSSSIYNAAEDDDIVGCTPLQLSENHWTEIQSLVSALPEVVEDQRKLESNYERFRLLIELYHDQPRLLDPVLIELVERLLKFVEFSQGQELSKLTIAALVRLKVLTTVRGYKTIIKLLPHEVNYLEKLLTTLEFYVKKVKNTSYLTHVVNQEALCILLVWLLIICKNPFNLAMFDSKDSREKGEKSTTERILACLEVFREWYAVDLRMKIVPVLLSQIVTRNEDNTLVLQPLIENSLETLKQDPIDEKAVFKELQLLVAIFKRGKRAEMLKYAKPVLNHLGPLLSLQSSNTHIRNFTVKLVQRLVVVFLRPRLAKWRYLCGVRSLEQNLQQPMARISDGAKDELKNGLEEEWYVPEGEEKSEEEMEEDEEEDDDDEEIPYEEVETGIGCILTSICDKENDVRWSGAKGLGRICARLPRHLGDMVILQVLAQNFDDHAPAGAWHGGCLALAELSRRGCLLPKRLPEVLEVLEKALRFDERHGHFSASVNVRDAACYICWAFARAYETKIMAPYMKTIAKSLINVALFDREVNIRRAASAAFQENVGRHGKVPRGIDINTLLDFVAVGIRQRCYLDLSVKLAELDVPEVTKSMMEFLVNYQTIHWDEKIRILASEALKNLAKFEQDHVTDDLAILLSTRISETKYLDQKHGSLFALAGLLEGLYEAKNQATIDNIIVNPVRNKLAYIVSEIYPSIASKRNPGVGLLMSGLCRYIKALAYVKMDLNEKMLLEWTDALDIIACEDRVAYHVMVQEAYRPILAYYTLNFDLLINRIHEKYLPKLKNTDREWDRVGAVLPLSCLPESILEMNVNFEGYEETNLAKWIADRLMDIVLDLNTPLWTSARVVAINALVSNLMISNVSQEKWTHVFESLIHALDDYTKTEHGDVGNYVRKAAITAFATLLPVFYAKHKDQLEDLLDLAINKILRQACEVLDPVRTHAALAMSNLLEHKIVPIKHRDVLSQVFAKAESENGPETDEDFQKTWLYKGYMQMEPLFEVKAYRKYVLLGFVSSAGNLIQSSTRSGYIALKHYAKKIKDDFEKTEKLLEDLHQIFLELNNVKESQMIFLNLIQMFFNERAFPSIEEKPDESMGFKKMVELVIKIATSKGTPKVKSMAMSTLSSFLQVNAHSQIWSRVMNIMISFLSSKYPALRSRSAQHLYEAFSCQDEPEYSSDEMQEALALLSETPWTQTGEKNEKKFTETMAEIGKNLNVLYNP